MFNRHAEQVDSVSRDEEEKSDRDLFHDAVNCPSTLSFFPLLPHTHVSHLDEIDGPACVNAAALPSR
jgi:hypothetical protein